MSYTDDLIRALEIVRAVLDNDDRVLDDPEPEVFVAELEEYWIKVSARSWAATSDWWGVLTSLPSQFRLRFEEEGLEVPTPKREVLLASEPGSAEESSNTSD